MARDVTMKKEDYVLLMKLYNSIQEHFDFILQHPEEVQDMFDLIMDMVYETIDEEPI